MEGPSRAGVWHDLRQSPWAVELRGYTFHFSSRRRCMRFLELARMEMEKLSQELTRRCGVRVCMDVPALFRLYHKVETNGFLVDCGERRATCPNEVRLDGFNPK